MLLCQPQIVVLAHVTFDRLVKHFAGARSGQIGSFMPSKTSPAEQAPAALQNQLPPQPDYEISMCLL